MFLFSNKKVWLFSKFVVALTNYTGLAQVLLIGSAYRRRQNSKLLTMLVRSATHTKAVSGRLSSPSQRTFWLGMVVAMALSTLVDEKSLQVKFDREDMDTPEALWYRHLVNLNDQTGSLDDLRDQIQTKMVAKVIPSTTSKKTKMGRETSKLSKQTVVIGPRIVEVVDSFDDDDDDALKPYAKPDSDAEDDDEDPTLVQRNKPRPPV